MALRKVYGCEFLSTFQISSLIFICSIVFCIKFPCSHRLFATPTSTSTAGQSVRKRRTLPSNEVVEAIIKSSPVPISSAEAEESITLLSQMCPFFIRKIDVGGEDWVEMPASAAPTNTNTDSVTGGLKGNSDLKDLKSLSPKRVKKEEGGLRQVRECIRKELEAD